MRGQVFIAPVDLVPEGRLVNPALGLFQASWQSASACEDVEVVGAEAAIEWGRRRSEIVTIRLAHRGDCFFSAGVSNPSEDGGPLSIWPADEPVNGWWQPPAAPTLAEVQAVAEEVRQGSRSAQEAAAWAWERSSPRANSDPDVTRAIAELRSGWQWSGGRIEPATD